MRETSLQPRITRRSALKIVGAAALPALIKPARAADEAVLRVAFAIQPARSSLGRSGTPACAQTSTLLSRLETTGSDIHTGAEHLRVRGKPRRRAEFVPMRDERGVASVSATTWRRPPPCQHDRDRIALRPRPGKAGRSSRAGDSRGCPRGPASARAYGRGHARGGMADRAADACRQATSALPRRAAARALPGGARTVT